MPSTTMLDLPGTSIFVEDSGEQDLPAVVCLHSLFLDGRMFDGVAAAAAGRFRIVRPDFRGQGRSAPAAEDLIDMDTCARDTEAVWERLGLGPAHLLAQSMGGDVGIRLAARRPELVRSMVLIGSSARDEPPEQRERFRQVVAEVEARGFVDELLETTMRIMFGATTRGDPSRREMLGLWRSRIAALPPGLGPAVRGVVERRSVVDLLPRVAAPVLVVSGEEDVPRPPAWADEVVRGLPDATLLRLQGVGHSPTLEAPDLVEGRILEFLADVERREGRHDPR